jgi:hypothetical protein
MLMCKSFYNLFFVSVRFQSKEPGTLKWNWVFGRKLGDSLDKVSDEAFVKEPCKYPP